MISSESEFRNYMRWLFDSYMTYYYTPSSSEQDLINKNTIFMEILKNDKYEMYKKYNFIKSTIEYQIFDYFALTGRMKAKILSKMTFLNCCCSLISQYFCNTDETHLTSNLTDISIDSVLMESIEDPNYKVYFYVVKIDIVISGMPKIKIDILAKNLRYTAQKVDNNIYNATYHLNNLNHSLVDQSIVLTSKFDIDMLIDCMKKSIFNAVINKDVKEPIVPTLYVDYNYISELRFKPAKHSVIRNVATDPSELNLQEVLEYKIEYIM